MIKPGGVCRLHYTRVRRCLYSSLYMCVMYTQPALTGRNTHTHAHTHRPLQFTFAMDNIILQLQPLPSCSLNPASLKPYKLFMQHPEVGWFSSSHLWLTGWQFDRFFFFFFPLYFISKSLDGKRNTGVYPWFFCITPPPALCLCRWRQHFCCREQPDQREPGGRDFHQKVWLDKCLVQRCAFVQEVSVSLPAFCTLWSAGILSSASVLQRRQTLSLIFLPMLSVMFPLRCLVLTAGVIICAICHWAVMLYPAKKK